MKAQDIEKAIADAGECIKWPPHSKETKDLVRRLREAVMFLYKKKRKKV
jgi:hypothetical protein